MRHPWWTAFLLLACASPPPERAAPPVERAFYYWRSDFSLTAAESQATAALGVSTLYTRFFDVVWEDGAAVPRAVVSFTAPPPPGVTVVPAVFLRNEVFRHTTRKEAIDQLATRVLRRVRDIAKAAALGLREIQVDCDWTDRTREAYFAFLDALGREAKAAGLATSVTIRLHQVKFRERTGVPPADRGMLMFYNMGPIDADPDTRAIFDKEVAARYLVRLPEYPLPLDAALPIWSWTVHLRDRRVVGLLQRTDEPILKNTTWLKPVGDHRYEALQNSFIAGELIRKGDLLEAETVGPEETATAARTLQSALLGAPARRALGRIALYALSERNLNRYDRTSLEHVYAMFR